MYISLAYLRLVLTFKYFPFKMSENINESSKSIYITLHSLGKLRSAAHNIYTYGDVISGTIRVEPAAYREMLDRTIAPITSQTP